MWVVREFFAGSSRTDAASPDASRCASVGRCRLRARTRATSRMRGNQRNRKRGRRQTRWQLFDSTRTSHWGEGGKMGRSKDRPTLLGGPIFNHLRGQERERERKILRISFVYESTRPVRTSLNAQLVMTPLQIGHTLLSLTMS